MNIPKKYRSWLLGAALLLTVAATASVNNQDDGDIRVVHPEIPKDREMYQRPEHPALEEADSLVKKLKRPALPEGVKDMFTAKSWYAPPPPPKIPPRPSAPPLPFNYIGKMLEEGDHRAVFLEKQSRIFVVREGDAIEASYRVDAINPPVMILTYLPLEIKQTVQIGEAN
ncbi:hypothetical protein [Sideroxydans sp. CL21]|uniref:hypothetical protein n=1 Tax=Sideroxydans sp. CL21 TaxID=2600596 RepID=UPI0024BC6B99|nr:hypothetical protein [Sideroxydans sp. CL21]